MPKKYFSKCRHINDQYEHYCKNTISGLQVSKEQYKRIISRFSILVIDKVLDAEEVKLPIIGTLRIRKTKQKYKLNKLKIDWYATKKSGKKIYHLNDDRNGYFYKYTWRKNKISYVSYYSFIPERWNLKRRLAKLLKTDKSKDFFES